MGPDPTQWVNIRTGVWSPKSIGFLNITGVSISVHTDRFWTEVYVVAKAGAMLNLGEQHVNSRITVRACIE